MLFLRHGIRVFGSSLLLAFGAAILPAGVVVHAQANTASCGHCHTDIAKANGTSPHGKTSAHHPSGIACESCHGDGKAHAGSNGDVSQIQNPARLSAKEVDERCLTCHSARHPDFAQSAHATAGVACTSCHSVHAGKEGKLLRAAEPALCYQCHSSVKADFSQPVHHKVDEGTVTCTACHDPHGTAEARLQSAIAKRSSGCVKCHTDKAGPFTYEHAAVRQAGCTSCHAPHGGSNPKLLILARVNTICLECHLPSATLSNAQTNAAHLPSSATPCTDCHAAIHGSNHDRFFAKP
jgi:DmsE family decaheme c-type cytochrome